MPEQVPSIGRQVHFVLPSGKHRPATIVEVWSGEFVNLQVMLDSGSNGRGNDDDPAYTSSLVWKTSVPHDETASTLNSWHWPEFVALRSTTPEVAGRQMENALRTAQRFREQFGSEGQETANDPRSERNE